MPRPKQARGEERWLLSLRKALIAEGAPVRKIAKRIAEALDAECIEVAKHQGAITDEKAYVDHPTRLKAATIATEIFAPRARQQGTQDERPILNVQAGAKVQLVFFGQAIDATPEGETVPDHSPELKAALVRAGKILPDGGVPKPGEATEATKALPKEKGREREGWLR